MTKLSAASMDHEGDGEEDGERDVSIHNRRSPHTLRSQTGVSYSDNSSRSMRVNKSLFDSEVDEAEDSEEGR